MTKAYFRWDGRIGITAILGISLIEFLSLVNVFAITYHVIYPRILRPRLPEWSTYIGVIILFTFILFNYFKYKGQYNYLRTYWKGENYRTRVLKGIAVILCLILPLISIIIIINYI